MSIDVVLPNLGESVVEATISRWLKAIGDQVERDEPLLEVSTDKVDTEIPAPAAGVLLEIRFNEDDTARIGDVVAVIGVAGAVPVDEKPIPFAWSPVDAGAASPQPEPFTWPPAEVSPAESQPEPFEWPGASRGSTPMIGTPPHDADALMRPSRGYDDVEVASEATIPHPIPPPPRAPTTIWGTFYPDDQDDTGNLPKVHEPIQSEIIEPIATEPFEEATTQLQTPGPYITPFVRQMAKDLELDLETVPGTGVGGRIRKQDLLDAVDYHVVTEVPSGRPTPPSATPDPRRGTTRPLSRERAAQADMVAQTSRVALSVGIEADVTSLRASSEPYLGHVLAAVAATLRSMAELNASVVNDAVVYHDRENLGLVISTADGPVTPVIHGASELSPAQLNAAAADLEARALAGELMPTELAAGTFTVHDGGPSGVAWSIPAINRPQVAAVSIGQISSRPVVVDDGHGNSRIASRDIMWLTLSYDRRVIDPDLAATFLARVRDVLSR